MGEEITRKRFPSRTPGVPTVSRGSQRKKAQQRDLGENVPLETPRHSKSAGKKHSKTKDLTI